MGNRILYDEETGELLQTLEPGDRFKVTRAEQIENFKNIQKDKDEKDKGCITIMNGEPFIKVYSRTLFDLSRNLTGTESQFINYLIQYIRYRSGILAYKTGKILTRRDMAIETGLSERAVDRLLQSLESKHIIGKHKSGKEVHFTVNPFIFMRGNSVNETLYTFYMNSHWAKEIKK